MSSRPPTFAENIARAAAASGLTQKAVRLAVRHLLHQVMDACWKHGNAEIPQYLSFRTGVAKARRVLNPITREPMDLPAARVMGARIAKRWRRRG